MDEGQGYGSEPPTAPPPAPMAAAPAPVPKSKAAVPALVLGAIALAVALIAMVAFPGPAGPAGPEGSQGPAGADGDDGDDGSDGADGADGADGVDGSNGTACWDLNENGQKDLPAEDINGDTVVDVNDCTGADGVDGIDGVDGADGADGIACWDLNGNGIGDLATEDINGDTVVDVLDCTGPQGPPGPGSIMEFAATTRQTTIGSSCMSIPEMEVTITVPTSGYIVISASVTEVLQHTMGTRDNHWVKIANNTLDCVDDQWVGLFVVTDDEPTADYWETTHLQRVEYVAAGAHTYYVNGVMMSGASVNDMFWLGNIVAVFYPA